jgi:ABC-type antimicrobial peptide transport system permease subunit
MSYELDRLMIICLGILVLLCLVAGGMTIAASVIHRSTQRAREVATRRVLGARRAQIVEMFLLENLAGIVLGLLAGSLLLLCAGTLHDLPSLVGLLCSTAVLTCAGLIGGWISGRSAAETPFSTSGLFASAPDKRGESNYG